MGKKLCQTSLKISKTAKKQPSSLRKVLRPKVYITDSSSFKKLVQELTGNAETISCPPPSKPEPFQKVTVIDVQDQGDSVSTINTLFHTSVDPFESCSCSQALSSNELSQLSSHTYHNHTTSDDHILLDDTTSDDFSISQEADMLAFQDLQSLVLDFELSPFNSSYSQFYQEDISIDDYELSGIL